MTKRPATAEDKALLSLLALKIERVGAWEESAERDATLSRLLAVHGELLDQVLADPITPAVLAQLDEPAAPAAPAPAIAPELEPSAAHVALDVAPEPALASLVPLEPLATVPATATDARPLAERIDFRGNPLPA